MPNVVNLSGDWDDFLQHIEASFCIKLTDVEIKNIRNYGQFCDLIQSKLTALKAVDDCATQQTFYKMRTLLAEQLALNPKDIHPKMMLAALFSEKEIYSAVERVEKAYWQHYKVHLDLMTLPFWADLPSFVLMCISILLLFQFFYWGLLLLMLSLLFRVLAWKTIRVLKSTTLGDLAKELADMGYLSMRRNPNTYNPKEIEPFIRRAFERYLGVEAIELERDTTFE